MLYADQEVGAAPAESTPVQGQLAEEVVATTSHSGGAGGSSSTYSYAVLTGGPRTSLESLLSSGDLPENVDPGRKEEFLSDAEFTQVTNHTACPGSWFSAIPETLQVLGMDRAAWADIPAWKQVAAKRANNLF